MKFQKALEDVVDFSNKLGINVIIKKNIDPFFKGDLDGETIYITDLDVEEKLFNVLHLVGHSIQWNVSEELRRFGNIIYDNPNKKLLEKIQEYEWEANCYALEILNTLGYGDLKDWLQRKFELDLMFLTNFYATGKKIKDVAKISRKYKIDRQIEPKKLPSFDVKKQELTRNGIVISF
jgi:hypothetical protein